MSKIKTILPWSFRLIISFLFLLSAIAKLYPSPALGIQMFEIKQLFPLGIDVCFAPYFSRFLIAAEIAIGIGILQPHYLKRFVIPVATLMLFVFSAHLTYSIFSTGNSGNCGCFGELIPMTPLQALIKNIIGIGLLIYLFFNCSDREKGKNSFSLLSLLYVGVSLFMFLLLPFCPCSSNPEPKEFIIEESLGGGIKVEKKQKIITDRDGWGDYKAENGEWYYRKKGSDDWKKINDAGAAKLNKDYPDAIQKSKNDSIINDSSIVDEKEKFNDSIKKSTNVVEYSPKKRRSKYRQHVRGIDEGKKILCFFAPGCDHCQDAVKEISKLSKQRKDFPEVYIIFMDEEAEKIPQFIKSSGRNFSYKLMDIVSFYGLLGNTNDTPGVVYLWNGNERVFFNGINENKFTSKKLLKALDKKK